ncbi:hypothetical protein A2U01_0087859, partial [Trifolium medium]|nr:hypothetical protein [Trifolium medium]
MRTGREIQLSDSCWILPWKMMQKTEFWSCPLPPALGAEGVTLGAIKFENRGVGYCGLRPGVAWPAPGA